MRPETLDRQVDGSHYKDMGIQPWVIIEKNKLDYFHGAVLKYLLRWQVKDGVIDLDKIIHYVEHIKALALSGHYGEDWIPGPGEKKQDPIKKKTKWLDYDNNPCVSPLDQEPHKLPYRPTQYGVSLKFKQPKVKPLYKKQGKSKPKVNRVLK